MMEYIIFDLEATCWDGNVMGRIQEIIEIGALRLDAYGKQVDSFERFVRPLRHPMLSMYCRNLTGIQQADIDQARTFAQVGNEFIAWLDQHEHERLLCSWGNKDLQLLISGSRDAGLDSDWTEPYIDLKADYHRIRGLQKKIGLKKALNRKRHRICRRSSPCP